MFLIFKNFLSLFIYYNYKGVIFALTPLATPLTSSSTIRITYVAHFYHTQIINTILKYYSNRITILDVRKIGHLNIKTKMLGNEAHVLIGWYSLASQSERVPTRCFYVKVAYLSYGEYTTVKVPYFATFGLFVTTVH